MSRQARRSRLVMGFDTHMIAGSRACSTSTRPILPTITSQTSPHYAEALVSTCTLCVAIVDRRFQDAHHHDDQADYEPFMVDGGAVDTCKVCGILVNTSYEGAHNRVHQANTDCLAPTNRGGEVNACKLCGTLVDQYYGEAHDRTHA